MGEAGCVCVPLWSVQEEGGMELLKLAIHICVLCVCVSLFTVLIFLFFYVMPSSECGANLSKTLPKSCIQIGKSDQRHTSAVAKINIQPFFAFTQTLSLNSFIFSTKEGDFQEPIKVFLSVLVCSLARYPLY